jgi:hypothetical protein
MSASGPLDGYLNDHLAGSAAALELIDKMRSHNDGTAFGGFLAGLKTEIQTDRASLERVMRTLGISRSVVKEAGGWMLEKASRIKLDEHVTGSGHLSRLMETEALSLGIEGKRLGWQALKQLLSDRELGVDLDALVKRAEGQRERLEPFRIEAAERALGES